MILAQDKRLHMAASALWVVILAPFLGIAVGTLISVIIGGCKELIWDLWLKRGCCDAEDMIADIIGALGGALLCFLVSLLLGL